MFSETPQSANHCMDPSTLAASASSLHMQPSDYASIPTMDFQYRHGASSPFLPSSVLSTQQPYSQLNKATNPLLLTHNTQDLNSTLARRSQSPSLLETNHGRNEKVAGGVLHSPFPLYAQRQHQDVTEMQNPPPSLGALNETGLKGSMPTKGPDQNLSMANMREPQPSDDVSPYTFHPRQL
jgi:hypothetical protein